VGLAVYNSRVFLGHFGLGFGAKKVAPSVSLGALFLACQFADLLWPTLLLLGAERVAVQPGTTTLTPLDFISYPYSHRLLMLVIWGLLFGILYARLTRQRARCTTGAIVLALLVVSHWFLDAVMHRPDLPLTLTGGTRVGLGLWSSLAGTLAIEFALFIGGILVYIRTTSARDRIGSIGLWTLVAFFVVVYLASIFGPPPPGAAAVAWSAQAMWLLVGGGYWVERQRRLESSAGL
jgi:hypothetical protein